MAKTYDCCGGKGKHLGGCPKASKKTSKVLPKGDIVKGHDHDYTLDRTKAVKVSGVVVGYNMHYRCLNTATPCPAPYVIEFESI